MAFDPIRTNQEQLRGPVEDPTFEELWRDRVRVPIDSSPLPDMVRPRPVEWQAPGYFLNPQPVRLAGPPPTSDTTPGLDLDAIYSTEPEKTAGAPKLDLDAIYATGTKDAGKAPQLDLEAIYSTEPAKAGPVEVPAPHILPSISELSRLQPAVQEAFGPPGGLAAAATRIPQAVRTLMGEAWANIQKETTEPRKGVPTPEEIEKAKLQELTAEPGMAHGTALGSVLGAAAVPGEALGEAYRPGSETARLVASVIAPLGGVGALAKLTKKAADVTGLVAPVGHALSKLRGAEGSDRIVALKAAREFRKSEPALSTPEAQAVLYQKLEHEAAASMPAKEVPTKPIGVESEPPRSGHFRRPVPGTKEGFIEYTVDGNNVEIRLPYIEEIARGKGLGAKAFRDFVDQALSEGKTVRSTSNNASMVKLYRSLEKRGYKVDFSEIEKHPQGDIVRGDISVTAGAPAAKATTASETKIKIGGKKAEETVARLQKQFPNAEVTTSAFTPTEQRVAKTWLEPLRASNRRMYTRIKKMTEGTDIDISDLDPTHMPRLAVGHTPELDKAAGLTAGEADPVQGGFFGRGLTKKTTTLEAPKYVTLVGENGSRTIVSDAAENQLLAYKNGKEAGLTGYSGELKPGSTITADNGRKFTVERSHTAELETETPTRYHKNAFYALALTNTKLRAVERNLKFLQDFKSNPQAQRWMTTNAKRKPADWKESKIPQLRGTYMHPKLRAVFDDFYKPGIPMDELDKLRRLNQASTSLIFWTPTPHAHNVLTHWVVDRGFDWASLAGYKSLVLDGSKAIKEVTTLGPKYRELLREGSGLIHAGVQTRNFEQQLAKRMGMEIEAHPERWAQVAKAVGMSPVNLAKAIYRASRYALWWSNDVMMMQRVLELERQGMSTARAIREAEKHIPSYKMPPEVLGSRVVSMVLQDPLITMFNRYHFGVFKSYGHMLHDMARGTDEERAATIGKMMVLGLISYVVYPKINEGLKQINPNLELPARGAAAVPVAIGKAVQGDSNEFWKTIGNLVIPSPIARTGAELFMGWRDWAGRKIAEPGDPAAKQAVQTGEHLLQTFVPPYGLASQATSPGGIGLYDKFLDEFLGAKEKSEGAQRYEARRESTERRAAIRRRRGGGRGPLERLLGE